MTIKKITTLMLMTALQVTTHAAENLIPTRIFVYERDQHMPDNYLDRVAGLDGRPSSDDDRLIVNFFSDMAVQIACPPQASTGEVFFTGDDRHAQVVCSVGGMKVKSAVYGCGKGYHTRGRECLNSSDSLCRKPLELAEKQRKERQLRKSDIVPLAELPREVEGLKRFILTCTAG